MKIPVYFDHSSFQTVALAIAVRQSRISDEVPFIRRKYNTACRILILKSPGHNARPSEELHSSPTTVTA